MPDSERDQLQIWGFIVAILTLVIPVFFQIYQPLTPQEKATSMVIFGTILFFIVVFFAINYLYKETKKYIEKINKNEKDIMEMNNKIEIDRKLFDFDKRIAILEKHKKSQIDPRLIVIIILLILLFIYLQSIGVIHLGSNVTQSP